MRESDALILILIPKYRHFKRWNAIIKNMAQGMSNTYTVTHYVKTTILILKNWFWKNQIGLVISRNLIFWEREISKKIPFLRNECCINIFQNSFLEFFNLLIFGQCEIFEFEDFFGIFSINWTNSKDCRYQWSLVSDKMIRLDSLTIEWPGHQLLHHQMNFVLNHDGWLSNDDYRHQREDNMSDGGLLV